MKLCGDTQCRRANELLPLSEFYVNRKRSDQLNRYCKICQTRRNRQSTLRRREQRNARMLVIGATAEPKQELTPAVKIMAAVDLGHTTRKAIKKFTGLGWDELTDELANLWDQRQLRIVKDGEEREFHPRAA